MPSQKGSGKKRLVLIDGHAILYRAYHALPKTLTNRHGQLINAAYGFTRMLIKVIEDLQPAYLAVAFDRPEPTFRHKEFVGYQAQRPKMDVELKDQIEIVKQILLAFGISFFEKPGFEADDLIGTLARQAKLKNFRRRSQKTKGKKLETVVVTGDRDIFQLINASTFVYAPQKGFSQAELFDRKKVKKLMGINPKQIVDYKGLAGDTSDNYPGVPGVGPKTATDLLQRFGSLPRVYKNLGKIKPSVRKKLEEGEEAALLSQKLARIETRAPVKLSLKQCAWQEYDREKVLAVFKKLGFRSLMNKLPGEASKEKKEVKKKDEQLGLL